MPKGAPSPSGGRAGGVPASMGARSSAGKMSMMSGGPERGSFGGSFAGRGKETGFTFANSINTASKSTIIGGRQQSEGLVKPSFAAPRSMGAYSEFGPKNVEAKSVVADAPRRTTSSEQIPTAGRSRFARVDTASFSATTQRIAGREINQASRNPQESVRIISMPQRSEATKTRPEVQQQPRQKDVTVLGSVPPERIRGAFDVPTTRVEDRRTVEAAPINPTRLAPEIGRTASVNPERKAAETVATEVTRIHTELARVGDQAPSNASKRVDTAPISAPRIPTEKDLKLPDIPDSQPLSSGSKWSTEQIARERKKFGLPPINHVTLGRTVREGSVMSDKEAEMIADKVQAQERNYVQRFARRIKGVTLSEPQVKEPAKQEKEHDSGSRLLVFARIQELLKKKKEKKAGINDTKVKNTVSGSKLVIGRVNSAAETGTTVALGLDTQPDVTIQTKRLVDAHIIPSQQLKEAAALKLVVSNQPAGKEQVSVQPVTSLKPNTSHEQSLSTSTEGGIKKSVEVVLFTQHETGNAAAFVVDQSAQKAREELAAKAIEKGEEKGEVAGIAVASAMSGQKTERVISGLLKKLGAQTKEVVDGSYEALVLFIAGMGQLTKREAKRTVQEGLEKYPAVLLGEGAKEATENEVRLVLSGEEVSLASNAA